MNLFSENLKAELAGILPGIESQREMSAKMISGQNFQFKHSGAAKKGAVLIMLYPFQGHWVFPLMKRPTYQGVHSDQISLPGGKIESVDHDLISTALRETKEELGVSVNRNQVVGCLTELYITASHYQVLPVVAIVEERPEYRPDPREVHSVVETKAQDLVDESKKKLAEIMVRGTKISAPYFDINDQMVWGATAMILNEFLSVLKKVY